ncbi:hypothetical protein OHB06_01410 [Streptomyces sp. NBC_01604]|uniref:hypothetical protein n=1 Tax=Streptomyces sp. NBC_01604 TaxID=2975894 RepID=UPI003868A5DD
MPAVSTPDSAPEEAAQRPAAERPEGAESPPAPAAQERGGHECAALDEPVDAGLAASVDGFDLDDGVFPLLDDAVLGSGILADVAGTASLLSGISDSFQPLAGLGPMLSGFTDLKNFGLASVLEGLPPLITTLPSLAKMAGTLAPNGFGTQVGLLRMQDVFRTRPPLADLIGGHVADLFAGVRSVADWAMRLKPSILAEARYAVDAYMKGDKEPMKEFLRRCLRLWPVLEDHCQALAVAMFERAWEQEADLTDDQSVRRVLIRYARQGCDSERDHQIRGASIGYIPEGWEQRDTVPGPEDLVIPHLVSWAEQFETAPVRYVAGKLNEQEQALVRAWSENHPMTWPKASDLVQQDKAQGERARRKLKDLGKEWRRRENNRQELP